jgi:thiamine monophosphate kinase
LDSAGHNLGWCWRNQGRLGSRLRQRWLETPDAYQLRLLSGGDDYEILFTAAPEKRSAVKRASRSPHHRIGIVVAGADLALIDSPASACP